MMHSKVKANFHLNSIFWAKNVDELKAILKTKQSFFPKPAAKGKTCTEASFLVFHILVKHKKSFTDGEVIHEAVTVPTGCLLKDFKNKGKSLHSRKCGSELLNIVDNYAVLQLEIVWCYLQLEQLDCLRDAEERLKRAQTRLNKCYGENLERLYNLKGNTANEQVLYLRLRLLQGVVLYHKGKLDQTKNHLNEAETLLGKLSVDDKKVVQLMSLGFTAQEARLGLRACNDDIDFAASHIYHRREEKAEIRRKEKAERKRKKQEAVNSLVAMGYSEKAAAKAFRSANNNLERAIEILQHSTEQVYMDDEEAGPSNRIEISEETINQVAFLGFDHSAAEIALRRFNGNIERAVQALIDHGGYLPSSLLNSPPSSTSPEDMDVEADPSEEKQREREIVEEVLADIPEHEEDYLDMTLEEEREVIIKYKTWLQGSHQSTL
ncbi:NEDD8 ultimate buster 1-like [Rhincodon typus]|uniref:NEDD8 ultimate buster 1-like n=1 Tax=Rhincodon typus TaxID=259920 RepID=UPI00202E6918|nr:NEDD8 ultimate buster 1-like [Rhincodon typus]